MSSPAEKLEDCCLLVLDVIDGKYGWFSEAFTLLGLIIVVNFFTYFVLKRLHLKYAARKKYWQDSFVRALYKPLSYYVWFIAIVNLFDLINLRVNGTNFFPLHRMHQMLGVGAILALGWFLFRWKKNFTEFMIIRHENNEIAMDKGKIDLIGKLATMVILFITSLVLLEISGYSPTTLVAFGGIGGLALAFASQELIANFFSGFMIYVTHPFAIGDWIKLPEREIEGHVEEIGWYMTRIRTFDKRPVYVPNSVFSRLVVMTPSRMSHRQFKEIFGIRYDDLPLARKIITDIKNFLDNYSEVDHGLHTAVHLHHLGSYAVEIQVEAYLKRVDPEGFQEIQQEILFKIAEVISANGAQLAYPTTTLQLPTQAFSNRYTETHSKIGFGQRESSCD